MTRFTRYVAVGDSQTEGMNDADGNGGYRGWADRFATQLAQHNPGLLYANLAIRGRRTPAILAEQLAPAIALRPDLVSVMAGVNDMLGSGYSATRVAADLETMYAAFTAADAQVLGCTFPDIGKTFSFAGYLSPRIRELNVAIRAAAARHNVILVEFEPHPATADPQLWSNDRLHLNPVGHQLIADAFSYTLGLHDDHTWQLPKAHVRGQHVLKRTVSDAEWVAKYFAPWMVRHLTGRSTGDGRTPKRPELMPLHRPESQESITG